MRKRTILFKPEVTYIVLVDLRSKKGFYYKGKEIRRCTLNKRYEDNKDSYRYIPKEFC